MRVPKLVVDRRHNVARLLVSFAGHIWDRRDVGDFVLGYNAAGRLSRVVFLDPRGMLPPGAAELEALSVAIAALSQHDDVHARDLEVLRSAMRRAEPRRTGVRIELAGA